MLQCLKIDESYQLYFKGEISIETIIQQITIDLKEEILKKACSEKITNLDSLAADIFEDCATEMSYQKSAELVSGNAVSRQSVRNHLLKLDIPEKQPIQNTKAVKELHILQMKIMCICKDRARKREKRIKLYRWLQ